MLIAAGLALAAAPCARLTIDDVRDPRKIGRQTT
jgi:hypothetical protein